MAERIEVDDVEHKMAVCVFYAIGGWLVIESVLVYLDEGFSVETLLRFLIGLTAMAIGLSYHYSSVQKILDKIVLINIRSRSKGPLGVVKNDDAN